MFLVIPIPSPERRIVAVKEKSTKFHHLDMPIAKDHVAPRLMPGFGAIYPFLNADLADGKRFLAKQSLVPLDHGVSREA